MARRPRRPPAAPTRGAAGGPSPIVFFGLVALLIALFGIAVWAALAEPLGPAGGAPAATAPTTAAAASASATASPSATPAQSPTRAVVLVERGPPSATPRPSPTLTAAPSATAPAPPTVTVTPTVTPTSTVSPTQTVTPTATQTATPAVPPTPSPQPIVYTVRQGDTLISIGQRFGVPWQAIAAANALPEDTVLHLDQQLVIPQQTS